MKVGITGVTGNVGSKLLEKLYTSPGERTLIAAGRNTEKIAELTKKFPNVQAKEFDFCKRETFKPLASSLDTIFINQPDIVNYSTDDFKEFLDELSKNGVYVVYLLVASSKEFSEALKDCNCSLYHHHIPGRKIIEESGCKYTFLEPGWFMQNFTQHYLSLITEKKAIIKPEDAALPYIHVDDIASAFASVILSNSTQHHGKSYRIAGGDVLTYTEVASLLSEVLNEEIKFIKGMEPNFKKEMSEIPIREGYTMFDLITTLWKAEEKASPTFFPDKTVYKSLTGKDYITLKQFFEENEHLFKSVS